MCLFTLKSILKEIAPLLNISVRSVEIKDIVSKKMELTHEQGLVEYILAI
jgi:hypothetical protein